MFKRVIFYILFLALAPLSASTQFIEVGLFSYKSLKKVTLVAHTSGYTIYGDGIRLSELSNFEGIRVELSNGKISLRSMSKDLGTYTKVEFRGLTQSSTLNIKGISPKTREQEYNDHIQIKVHTGSLQLVNIVNIENYVGGVVEAESVKGRPLEFYNVQSIISRTYALANFRRHEDEGYQLCDAVHCQVYHGLSKYEPLIPIAVENTKGIVIVNSDIELITAAFSSNCGGKTRNAEDVWSKEVSYLKSKSDSFCLESEHAKWEKTISMNEWKTYKKIGNSQPLQAHNEQGSMVMDNSYSEFIYEKNDLIAIRKQFNLNSTRFVMVEEGQSMQFTGRGFGHGVGLCQEGASSMAEHKYSYKEILDSYYTDIHLIQLSSLNFFKSE